MNGIIEAFNELDAVQRIKETCNVVVKVAPEGEGNVLQKLGSIQLDENKLNAKAFTLMCNQFAVILQAGVPIARAVSLVSDKMTDKNLRRVLNQVASDVEAGRSISSSFEERGGKLIPVTFIESIRAGEESGNLAEAFSSVSEHYKKQMKMSGKVRGALIYPAFVLIIAIAVVIVLMVKVVPTFTAVFDEMGSDLPGMTKALIAISDFFRHYILYIIAFFTVFFIAVKLYGNTEEGRLNIAKLSMKLPVIGNIQILNSASQFANTMTMMLGAGLPLTRSISITARVISNYHVSQEVGMLSGKLEEGRTLGYSMRESGCLPDILVDMTAVGEETGELERTMGTIAEYYDTELEQATADALAKLEPAILVVLAVIAGFIVISIYMAMFTMYNSM